MAEYVSVLNAVIRLRGIRKIDISYHAGTNYNNQYIHKLYVRYEDGEEYEYRTTDREKAERDYEGLKNALLNYDSKMDGKDGEGK